MKRIFYLAQNSVTIEFYSIETSIDLIESDSIERNDDFLLIQILGNTLAISINARAYRKGAPPQKMKFHSSILLHVYYYYVNIKQHKSTE